MFITALFVIEKMKNKDKNSLRDPVCVEKGKGVVCA